MATSDEFSTGTYQWYEPTAQPAQPAPSNTRKLAFFCGLYFVTGLMVGLTIAKAVGL